MARSRLSIGWQISLNSEIWQLLRQRQSCNASANSSERQSGERSCQFAVLRSPLDRTIQQLGNRLERIAIGRPCTVAIRSMDHQLHPRLHKLIFHHESFKQSFENESATLRIDDVSNMTKELRIEVS